MEIDKGKKYKVGNNRSRRPAEKVFNPRTYGGSGPVWRRPLPKQGMDNKPVGGVDYERGTWRDKNGNIIAHAKTENSQYITRDQLRQRNSGNSPVASFSSVARRKLSRKRGS